MLNFIRIVIKTYMIRISNQIFARILNQQESQAVTAERDRCTR